MKKLYTIPFILFTILSFEQVFTSSYNFAGIVAVAPTIVSTYGLFNPPPTEAV